VDEEGEYRSRDRPEGQLKRRQIVSVSQKSLLDQHDGPDCEENVFTKEQPDIVGRGGISLDRLGGVLVECAVLFFGGCKRHWSDQWANRLRMAGGRVEADRRGDLSVDEVEDQQASGGCLPEAADQGSGALLESVPLEQADHRKHDPDNGNDPVVVERLAEGPNDLDEIHSTQEPGDDRRRGDDEHRIKAKREADNDQRDAEQRPVIGHEPGCP
jgi:hypothetical protein